MNSAPVRLDYQGPNYKLRTGTRVILMTATISPPPGAVARADPRVRIRDYCNALLFYTRLASDRFDRIVFVDNSASDLGAIVEEVSPKCNDKHIEFLSFQGNDHSPKLGKAYGEFRLLDTALTYSQLVQPNDRIWKTTGRLCCLNLEVLDRSIVGDVDLACDLHNVPFVGTGKLRGGQMMDLRLFAFRKEYYDEMVRGQWACFGHDFDAHVLYKIAVTSRKRWNIRPRFPRQPIISGRSGRTQRSYLSASQRLKDGFRGLLRNVVPWIWL
jgi:hypothetical protein